MGLLQKMKLKKVKTLGKMPVDAPKRELKEVIAEYGDLVANVGERRYKIELFEREIHNMYRRIDQVQAEATEIQKDMAKKASEDKAQTETTTEDVTTATAAH